MKRRLTRLGIVGLAVGAFAIVGASPAAGVTRMAVFNQCQTVFVPILDNQASIVQANVVVPKNGKKVQDGLVTDVNAGIRITHTFDSDLTVALINPVGKVVNLSSQYGGSNDNYGNGLGCGGVLTSFDDLFTTPISTGSAPFAGAFKPDQPLATFNGGPARGPWTLAVIDGESGDIGSIDAFSVTVTYNYNKTKKKKKKK
jgi:subtilisin-like proprotein convertase family protein